MFSSCIILLYGYLGWEFVAGFSLIFDFGLLLVTFNIFEFF